ncbi:MAG: hypothetical protein NVS4B10_09250 [Myxococcales bacterium]
MRRTSLAFLAALLCFPGPSRAADVRVDGSYRIRFALDTDLALDDQGQRLGQRRWAEHRLRLTPKVIQPGVIEIQGSFDVVSGLLGGDVANDFRGYGFTERSNSQGGLHATGFDFRHLFAQLRVPAGVVEFGQMPSHWGMGMVTHGGNGEEETDFGDVRFGDIVDRVLYATRPFAGLGPRVEWAQRLTLALAGDLIYRDRYASFLLADGGGLQVGDVAFQAVGELRFDPTDKTRAGLYVARRVQSYAKEQGNRHVWIFDLHARTLFELGLFGGSTLALEGEGAQVYGGTSHVTSLASPGSTRISQQGGALRAVLSASQLEGELEAGYASGDASPFSGESNAFAMSRDYKVSLVLFDEVLLFQSQNAARRLSDPRLSGRPQPGVDLVPTEGAVTDALYLKPTIRYRPALLGGRVRFVGSLLWARAPQPYVDLYNALLSSRPRNAFNAAAGQSYGLELDAGVSYRERFGTQLGVELGLQGGVLFPGNAFNFPDGTRMGRAYAAKLRATLTF